MQESDRPGRGARGVGLGAGLRRRLSRYKPSRTVQPRPAPHESDSALRVQGEVNPYTRRSVARAELRTSATSNYAVNAVSSSPFASPCRSPSTWPSSI